MKTYPKYHFKDPEDFHSRILLLFMGLSVFFMLLAPFFFPPNAGFLIDYPVVNSLQFIAYTGVAIGSCYSDFLKKHLGNLAFAGSILFCLYLSYSVYESQLNFYIMRYYWVFIAVAGVCFSKRIHLILLLWVTYITTTIVHFVLPPEVIYYPMWSYVLFTPPLAFVFYTLVSQSIAKHEKLMESERSLRRKSEELDTILDTLNAMVAYKDSSNVLRKVNQAMANFMGMTKEEAEGMSLYDIVDPKLAREFHEEDKLVMKFGKPLLNRLEKIVSPQTKETLWFRTSKFPYLDENGQSTGVVFSSEDVTDQVQAEAKLRESEERFRMIFEYAPDGMALIDNSNWNFIKINRAFAEMLGYSESEIKLLSPFDIVHPEDVHICRDFYHEVTCGNLIHYISEKRYIHKNGKIVYGSLSVYVVREKGHAKYMIASLKDVTKQKESDIQLKHYARRLEESNQNLQEFAYAASHDRREPLRTVVSYVQLLKRKLPGEHLQGSTLEFMDFIIGGAMRMEMQIQALLDYSRVGKGELQVTNFDLKDAVERVCLGLRKQMIDNEAIVEVQDAPQISGDRFQIEALLQNLISNAIKYRSPQRKPHVIISAGSCDIYWKISISDNGIGIAEEFLDKIFAVFRRLHSQDHIPGTGVGLAICRRITQRHGGKIWAESQKGYGTTFHFILPKASKNGSVQNPSIETHEIASKLVGA